MVGVVQVLAVPATAPGLRELIDDLDLPVDSTVTSPNIPDLADLSFLAGSGLSGPALLTSANWIGGFISLEIVMLSAVKKWIEGIRFSSRDEVKARLKADIGDRFDQSSILPEGLRAPRGGRIGDLLWYTGSGWEALKSEGGSVLVTTPRGDPVWLPIVDFLDRLELAPQAPEAADLPEGAPPPPSSFVKRADRVESAPISDLLSRIPLVWYALGDRDGEERLRPALLHSGSNGRGEQRLTVFLSPEDTDWLALTGGDPTVSRTGIEGQSPGSWRRI